MLVRHDAPAYVPDHAYGLLGHECHNGLAIRRRLPRGVLSPINTTANDLFKVRVCPADIEEENQSESDPDRDDDGDDDEDRDHAATPPPPPRPFVHGGGFELEGLEGGLAVLVIVAGRPPVMTVVVVESVVEILILYFQVLLRVDKHGEQPWQEPHPGRPFS